MSFKKIIIVFLMLFTFFIGFYFNKNDEVLKLNDGVYSSVVEGHVTDLEVIIIVDKGIIIDVEIKHNDTIGIADLATENIPLEIIYSSNPNKKTLNVDVVSGATSTSKAIISALKENIDKAK